MLIKNAIFYVFHSSKAFIFTLKHVLWNEVYVSLPRYMFAFNLLCLIWATLYFIRIIQMGVMWSEA